MRVHLATDHAAFELKQYLAEKLGDAGFEVVDHGAEVLDPQDDYPPFIIAAAEAVAAQPGDRGIVLGGSGNGELMAANKVKGVRCAFANTVELASLTRQHNDANCLAIGGRFTTEELALEIAIAFLTTPFSFEERHQRRIDMLTTYEVTGSIEA
ncbi:ribose-5-phosphate isomerase [Aestuariimicrobium sp. T2.26MG-19.2B]|uniref:ribose-5-phosphate isomerase n=1 Tax=Aestuariimicrobium sp. T2.26MG-19.2B TaxID=3040679 RepID=UPI002477484E|nr:ribose-5-phosphate isomerase [Aestuariimicrobium sp. T2.26MG-19.2B]CAI9407815.1 Ribose-5-phosphate isomerase B [Aestuariimicrobium sp. T2.26MG-19.2B]